MGIKYLSNNVLMNLIYIVNTKHNVLVFLFYNVTCTELENALIFIQIIFHHNRVQFSITDIIFVTFSILMFG